MKDAGKKLDEGKLRLDLIPGDAIKALGRVVTFGANKYADRNWEKGIAFNRVYGAALRHLVAWWDGEDIDPESGLNHVDHALCNLAFLTQYISQYEKYKDFDTRPIGGKQ